MYNVYLCNVAVTFKLKSFRKFENALSFVDERMKGKELALLEDPRSNYDIFWYDILKKGKLGFFSVFLSKNFYKNW